jgi:hypothetical protein
MMFFSRSKHVKLQHRIASQCKRRRCKREQPDAACDAAKARSPLSRLSTIVHALTYAAEHRGQAPALACLDREITYA